VNSYTYLFWGYNVVWGMLALYIIFLTVRLRRVGRRLERLERSLKPHD
jgi:CcmD family protein